MTKHRDDDLYNQAVLRAVADLVRDAEADAEAGWEQLQKVTAAHARLRSALVTAEQHLLGQCLCRDAETCRARTLALVSEVLREDRG